ncbi:hypothetical protein [Oerskovia sp. Root22]|uniref:hypothetical protein n=1 Tax=Oerskovia sp. Root22 TaxID=1736494 RepID=UPI0006F361A4|nr:hypothetical protein [Oerskovia sp. Root22]KRC37512.1 hypothetical protein ASE15_05205 [Oerskovia sp. Root22]
MGSAWAIVLAAAVGALSALITNWFDRALQRRDLERQGVEQRRQFLRENLIEFVEFGRARGTAVHKLATEALRGFDPFHAAVSGAIGTEHREASDRFRVALAKIRLTVSDGDVEEAITRVKKADSILSGATGLLSDRMLNQTDPLPAIGAILSAIGDLNDTFDELIESARARLADPIET